MQSTEVETAKQGDECYDETISRAYIHLNIFSIAINLYFVFSARVETHPAGATC